VYRDLPVTIDGDPAPAYESGTAEIIPGQFVGDAFDALTDDEGLHILHGVQGGRWIHIGMRVRGVPSRSGQLTVQVDATPAGGAPIAQTAQPVRATANDGWLEVRQIQIHVDLSDPAVSEIDGDPVSLRMRYEAEGELVEAVVKLVLVDG
jgi:hypothetical protein